MRVERYRPGKNKASFLPVPGLLRPEPVASPRRPATIREKGRHGRQPDRPRDTRVQEMDYLLVKALHILSAILLFGTGLGSAFYKYMADRRGDIAGIAITSRHVVLADWLFTMPTVIFQPLSGIWLLHRLGIPFDLLWVQLSFALYGLAGLCWLPVVVLQIRMRNLARIAHRERAPLPAAYHRAARYWFWLGIPAFASMVAIVVLMVFQPA